MKHYAVVDTTMVEDGFEGDWEETVMAVIKAATPEAAIADFRSTMAEVEWDCPENLHTVLTDKYGRKI